MVHYEFKPASKNFLVSPKILFLIILSKATYLNLHKPITDQDTEKSVRAHVVVYVQVGKGVK